MIAKKAVRKKVTKPQAMKKTFDIFVYKPKREYGTSRVHVYAQPPAPSVDVTVVNGTPEVTIGGVDTESSVWNSYCSAFEKDLGVGTLPENKIIKWSITAEIVPDLNAKTLQKQILEKALAKLK